MPIPNYRGIKIIHFDIVSLISAGYNVILILYFMSVQEKRQLWYVNLESGLYILYYYALGKVGILQIT